MAGDLGLGTAVVDLTLAAKRMFGRLPEQRDAFTEGEYRRALKLRDAYPSEGSRAQVGR